MISQFAIAEIEKMQDEGLKPTPADIIRLNAIGLKVDHSAGEVPFYLSRRTATVEGVVLQEPTIGHVLYYQSLKDYGFDLADETTATICHAWVCSFDVDRLPPVVSAEFVHRAICAFVETYFRRVTFARLKMAVCYVLYGYDSAALEFPAPVEEKDDTDRTADDAATDDAWDFAIGIVHHAESLGLGISLADARRHTVAEFSAICTDAVERQHRLAFGSEAVARAVKNDAEKQFYATLIEIRTRLENEREKEEANHG